MLPYFLLVVVNPNLSDLVDDSYLDRGLKIYIIFEKKVSPFQRTRLIYLRL